MDVVTLNNVAELTLSFVQIAKHLGPINDILETQYAGNVRRAVIVGLSGLVATVWSKFKTVFPSSIAEKMELLDGGPRGHKRCLEEVAAASLPVTLGGACVWGDDPRCLVGPRHPPLSLAGRRLTEGM